MSSLDTEYLQRLETSRKRFQQLDRKEDPLARTWFLYQLLETGDPYPEISCLPVDKLEKDLVAAGINLIQLTETARRRMKGIIEQEQEESRLEAETAAAQAAAAKPSRRVKSPKTILKRPEIKSKSESRPPKPVRSSRVRLNPVLIAIGVLVTAAAGFTIYRLTHRDADFMAQYKQTGPSSGPQVSQPLPKSSSVSPGDSAPLPAEKPAGQSVEPSAPASQRPSVEEAVPAAAPSTAAGTGKPQSSPQEPFSGPSLNRKIDFGDFTSSTLTAKSWKALKNKDYELALIMAGKCVQIYEKQALKMQSSLTDFVKGDKDKILSYWALNDVGTSLFIRGEALERSGRIFEALTAYETLVKEFPYAQSWDPRKGGFWKPAEAARMKIYMIRLGDEV